MNPNLSLVLQGLPNEECLNLWIKNYSQWNVIVSTWENVDLSSYKIPKNWKVIKSQLPLFRYYSTVNLDYQIHTTLRGLELVETPYVIKARLDEYWTGLEMVGDLISSHPQKIITSSMFFRTKDFASSKYKFHIGDKILGGTTDNVLLMFESTLHNLQMGFWETHNPEGQLGLGYVMGKEPNLDWDEIKQTLNLVNNDKPSDEDLKKNLKQIVRHISNTSMELATDFLSYKKVNWSDVGKKVKQMFDQVNWIKKQLDIYHTKESFDDSTLLKKWFYIVDINNLKPYIATQNFRDVRGRKWFRSFFNHKKNECITNIKDY